MTGNLLWAAVAGVAIGTVSAFSPATIWFAIVLGAIFMWAGRGLGSRERRWVMVMLGVAVALRVAMVAGLFLSAEHARPVYASFPLDDDGRLMKIRSTSIRAVWIGVPVDPVYWQIAFDAYGWSSYILVLAYVQFLLGSAPYGVHLFNIALSIAGGVLLFRTMRRAYGSAVGVGGLALLLFMPSLFFWSVTAMKESFQFFVTAIVIVATASVWQARTSNRRVGALVLAPLAIAALATVRRDVALALGVGGTAVGLFAFVITRRLWLFVAAVAVVVAAGVAVLPQPAVQAQVVTMLRPAALAHLGNVHTDGHGYKLLDQRFYSGENLDSMTFPEAGRYVLRALASFVITPAPWQTWSKRELAFLPQQTIWYVLVVLAVVGVLPGFRRDPLMTCLLCGYVVVGAAVISLASGNVGTYVRHRDIVTPFVVWLSALGGERVLTGFAGRARQGLSRVRLRSSAEAACP